MVLYFSTFALFYVSEGIPRVQLIILQAVPASLAALIDFIFLSYTENPRNMESKISLIVLAFFLFVQPFFPGYGLLLALNYNLIFLSLEFWIYLGGFLVSWFTGRMIVREVFFFTHKDLIVD
jgi:hypothetical protein